MKIKLEYPFTEDFKAGYLNMNKEPRRVVLLVREDNTKTSLSYARYLMTVYLKRYLKASEHVDHIDNNKLNDVIDNLQILTPRENNIKKNKHLNINKAKDITMNCPVCGKDFSRPSRQVKHKLEKGQTPTCSRSCGGKFSHVTKYKNISLNK